MTTIAYPAIFSASDDPAITGEQPEEQVLWGPQ
jgi:hypothetical protein